MSRRRRAEKRKTDPDPRYGSTVVARLINKVMIGGKKSTSRKIIYQALDTFSKKINSSDPLKSFEEALENVKPLLEVKSKRIGGATYQVPMEVAPRRKEAIVLRWIIKHSRAKKGRPMSEALASELIDCYNRQGTTFKKKEDTHKMAEANKAFAHFR